MRTALGMPIGAGAERFPPPWLIAMQRYGPPPSYPNLKIPGLNAPIPENCSFGYHAGKMFCIRATLCISSFFRVIQATVIVESGSIKPDSLTLLKSMRHPKFIYLI